MQHRSNNIEIKANDSMYVFVQVNVNPTTANLPFIIRDSIQVSYNGNNKLVQLEAWGQNAHFFRDKEVTAMKHGTMTCLMLYWVIVCVNAIKH